MVRWELKRIRFYERCKKCQWHNIINCFKCESELIFCCYLKRVINELDDLDKIKNWNECKFWNWS